MSEDGTASAVRSVHEHLVATQELPVETAASRWLGEAEAVAADLVDADLDDADVSEDVVRERMGHVRDLLANVEGTGHSAADEHVAAARELTRGVLDRLDED